jgi:acyl-CoA dehydrogenase
VDFALTPELEALKREIRAFLEAELPDEVPEPQIVPETGTDEEFAFQLAFSKKLAEHGWYTAQWPKEHGGRGFDAYQALVVGEELGSHGVSTVNSIGHLVASLLMQYGDEEQQQRFLPGIANCDVIWGEGYSEPDSGADLASLRTVARKDGDEYVVDGTKIWTGAG